jgi:hypothetical protein
VDVTGIHGGPLMCDNVSSSRGIFESGAPRGTGRGGRGGFTRGTGRGGRRFERSSEVPQE